MTALKKLRLWDNKIGDKGCEALALVLPQMTALKELNLWNNQIGAKGCEALAPALPQMTALKKDMYNFLGMIGAIGGSLGFCVGFSIFDVISKIVDQIYSA